MCEVHKSPAEIEANARESHAKSVKYGKFMIRVFEAILKLTLAHRLTWHAIPREWRTLPQDYCATYNGLFIYLRHPAYLYIDGHLINIGDRTQELADKVSKLNVGRYIPNDDEEQSRVLHILEA